MLLLKRTTGQSVIIGEGPDAVTVTVMQMEYAHGIHSMRLGFDAPKHVKIDRLEIRQSKEATRAAKGTA